MVKRFKSSAALAGTAILASMVGGKRVHGLATIDSRRSANGVNRVSIVTFALSSAIGNTQHYGTESCVLVIDWAQTVIA